VYSLYHGIQHLCKYHSLCRNLGLGESGVWEPQSTVYVLGGSESLVPGNSPLCARLSGLSPGQRRFCQLYEDHMPSVARGVQLAVVECQRQFRFRRWNCSTTPHRAGTTNVTSSLFGHVTNIGQWSSRVHCWTRTIYGQATTSGHSAACFIKERSCEHS